MEAHVVIATDLTIALPNVGHVMPMLSIEVPVNIEWAIWANSSKHALARNVLHQGSPMAQAFHDCGKLIAHLQPLDIILGPIQSSRQIMFSAMDVLIEGEPVGFAEAMTPMLTCGLVPMPVGAAVTSYSNDVIVGMDFLWDFVLCWAGTIVEMVIMGSVNTALTIAGMATGGGSTFAAEVGKSAAETLVGIAVGELLSMLSPGRRYIEDMREQRGQGDVVPPFHRGPYVPSWDEI